MILKHSCIFFPLFLGYKAKTAVASSRRKAGPSLEVLTNIRTNTPLLRRNGPTPRRHQHAPQPVRPEDATVPPAKHRHRRLPGLYRPARSVDQHTGNGQKQRAGRPTPPARQPYLRSETVRRGTAAVQPEHLFCGTRLGTVGNGLC